MEDFEIRREALQLAINTYGNMFDTNQLVEVASKYETYLRGPTQDAPQS